MVERRQRVALAVLLLLAPAIASAEPASFVLDYRVAPGLDGCPAETGVRDGVAARLGRDPFGDRGQRITATITAEGDGLRATIDVAGAGERQLRAAVGQCADLAAAVELAIAIAIDPGTASRPEAPVPARSAAPVAPAPIEVEQRPAAVRASPVPIGLVGRVEGAFGYGSAPGIPIGITVGVEVRRNNASVALEGNADFTGSESTSMGRLRGGLLSAAVVPCAHRGHLAACAVVMAGAMRATSDVTAAREATSPFYAAGGRLAWSWPVGSVAGTVRLDLVAPLARTHLRLGGEVVWSTAPLAAVVGVGISRALW